MKMAFALRRYCRRNLRVQSITCWVCLGIIAVILISSFNVMLNRNEDILSDYTHPISIRWRTEWPSTVIRPELETAIIQPRLNNNSICKKIFNHERLLDEESLQVLIMVMSAPPNIEARKAIRNSWGNKLLLPPEIEIYFILGTTPDEKIMEMVEKESEKYNDVIVEDFLDSYENLTYKALFTLKWTTKWCSTVTHLLKTDDDMMIIPQNLIKRLQYVRNNYFLLQTISTNKKQHIHLAREQGYANIKYDNTLSKQILTGEFTEKKNEEKPDNLIMKETHTSFTQKKQKEERNECISGAYILGRVHRQTQPYRNSDSKWFLPFSLYYEDYLPDFTSGTAYIIADGDKSCGAIKSLFINSLMVKPILPLEDVFITGIVAQHLGLPLIEDEGFLTAIPMSFPWSLSRLATCYYYNLIAIHGLKPKDILIGWLQLNDLEAEECNTISGYIHKTVFKFLSIFEVPIDKISG